METKDLEGVSEALSSEDLMQGSESCRLFSEVVEELKKESEGKNFDAYAFEKGQTWSDISTRPVCYDI